MAPGAYNALFARLIAAAGFLHLERGRLAPPDLSADANLKL